MNKHLYTAATSMLQLELQDLLALMAMGQALTVCQPEATQPVAPLAVAGLAATNPKRSWPRRRNLSTATETDGSLPSWLARSDDQAGVEVDPDLFGSRAYEKRWEPRTLASFYMGQCPGSAGIAQRLGTTIYKQGLTTRRYIAERMAELGQIGYGAVYMGDAPVVEPGFDAWAPTHLPLFQARPTGSPVRAGRRCLEFTLPVGVTLGSVDDALREALLPYALRTYIDSPDGQAACASRGLDPRSFRRFTARQREGQTVLEEARELTLLRPRRDAGRLASILERIIAMSVMARRP